MNREAAKEIINAINESADHDIKLMEVCGTHTQAIAKAGLSSILSPHVTLISGPGCPVCVTAEGCIDAAIKLLQQRNTILVSFGDMIRVKGSSISLEDCMELRERIRIVYSPFTALDIAERERGKEVVFLAVGFETTAPVIAALVKLAQARELDNISFLTALKLMPPVLSLVLSDEKNRLDGIICPGHVSTVMGADYFDFVPGKYGIPAAVAGFEQKDVLSAVYWLVQSISGGTKSTLFNIYGRCVQPEGNVIAKSLIEEVFGQRDGYWRGIGCIKASELFLREDYRDMDAEYRFGVHIEQKSIKSDCQCSEIIIGSKSPAECRLFASGCTPEHPKGPCMISSEGSCAIYYKYKRSCDK
ncbi:MAG: hydrogenase formation protein HypD [Clostridia bacterium]|jgi:hydrogenase expression/formation protein HypD|nr:hydrogenase formation protein HypD [Clostridia bacterium]